MRTTCDLSVGLGKLYLEKKEKKLGKNRKFLKKPKKFIFLVLFWGVCAIIIGDDFLYHSYEVVYRYSVYGGT